LPKGAIGLDKLVIDTVLGSEQNKKVFSKIINRVKKAVKIEGDDISIAFDCRSGIHRSVVFAEELARQMEKSKIDVEIKHIHLKPR